MANTDEGKAAYSEEEIAFRLELVPGMRDAYQQRHDRIWPDLERALIDAGVIEYRIFNAPGDTALFAVMRRRVDHRLDDLAGSELMRRWWEMMRDVTVTGDDGRPVECGLDLMYRMRPGDQAGVA